MLRIFGRRGSESKMRLHRNSVQKEFVVTKAKMIRLWIKGDVENKKINLDKILGLLSGKGNRPMQR